MQYTCIYIYVCMYYFQVNILEASVAGYINTYNYQIIDIDIVNI